MQLSTERIAVIKKKASLMFGDDARFYLFVSAIYDDGKDGDIDLFINSA